jgi:hypothetical protein
LKYLIEAKQSSKTRVKNQPRRSLITSESSAPFNFAGRLLHQDFKPAVIKISRRSEELPSRHKAHAHHFICLEFEIRLPGKSDTGIYGEYELAQPMYLVVRPKKRQASRFI